MPAQRKALRLASNVRIPSRDFRTLRMIHFVTKERVEERCSLVFGCRHAARP